MAKITVANYRKDECFPAVAKAIEELVREKGIVTPLDILIKSGRITRAQVEDWRIGRIPFLEQRYAGNLSKASRIPRIIQFHATHLGLKPSRTEYRQWGKGNRRIKLRFSKTGDPGVEAAYATHWLSSAACKKKPNEPSKEAESPAP